MQTYKLTEEDVWFIEKGQIDSLSRSPFQIGDEVVVCDRRHVMLAKFYDGECPSCNSRKTVPFSRQNVETGTLKSYAGQCPNCTTELTVFLRQFGAGRPYVGKCPKCKHEFSLSATFFKEQARREKLKMHIGRTHAVLGWTLGLLIVGVVILSLVGVVSHDRFALYAKKVIWPRTLRLFDCIPDFIISQRFSGAFASFNGLIAERTAALLIKGVAVLSVLWAGIQETCTAMWKRSMRILINSEIMRKLFIYRTKLLFEWIRNWVSGLEERFTNIGGMSI